MRVHEDDRVLWPRRCRPQDQAAQNLGATRLDVLREVILPGSLPGINQRLKVCLALAWTCVLSAEMVAATHGLGALIWFAKTGTTWRWSWWGWSRSASRCS